MSGAEPPAARRGAFPAPRLSRNAARLLAIGMLALLAGCAAEPPRPLNVARDDYAAVTRHATELIRYEMEKNAIVGLSIALVDDQRIVWAAGFGHADKERQRPATAQTLYRIGSISKLFTATAAMQLAEQGRLDIDQPLQNYLPGFSIQRHPADASESKSISPITPRNLMTHHAGLPRDVLKGLMNPHPQPFTALANLITTNESAAIYATATPDSMLSYSNVGATLLGHAIQNVTGVPFADHLRQTLLLPLGMTESSFSSASPDSPLMARAYRHGQPADDPPLRDIPAGGLNSSVIDLGRFLSMIFADGKAAGGQILKPATLAEMLRPQNAATPLDLNFHVGLGWMLSTLGTTTLENAGPVAHHGGSTIFFRSQLYALPEHKLGVVVLTNTSSTENVVDRIAVETLSLALEARSGIRQPELTKPARAALPWPASALQAYVGDYASMVGLMRIRLEGGALRADAAGRSFDLVPREDGQLGLEYSLLGILRINLGALDHLGLSLRRIAGRDRLVARIRQQELLVGERLDAPGDLGRWRQHLGTYRVADLGGDYPFIDTIVLREEDGRLLAEVATNDNPDTSNAAGQSLRLPLSPVSDEDAIILNPGPFSGGGETLHCATDACSYSGYRLQKISAMPATTPK